MEYVLVSACLLGLGCRYDGKRKADERVTGLLGREGVALIPACPEQMGGLPTPRNPAERRDGGVWNQKGEEVTGQFLLGATETLKLAQMYGCKRAILKERSPSCGSGRIYDGTFTGTLTDGDGTAAELLKKNGIEVAGESEVAGRSDGAKWRGRVTGRNGEAK